MKCRINQSMPRTLRAFAAGCSVHVQLYCFYVTTEVFEMYADVVRSVSGCSCDDESNVAGSQRDDESSENSSDDDGDDDGNSSSSSSSSSTS